ncbi:MAG: hypothetical protein QOF68_1966 [Gaiellales bacterium]|nr:hypothetical protein [Gaiellales bacterium]
MIIDTVSGQPLAAVDANGPITSAVADGAGGWFIAGGFTMVDGRARANLAHVGADGSLDTGWRGPELGRPAALVFISVARDGPRVFLAGAFDVPGRRRPGVVALHASNGSLDSTWTTPRNCYNGAWAAKASDGRVWVATACGAPPCLVAVSASTGDPTPWSARIEAIGEIGCVNDMTIEGNTVFFTGGFTAAGGRPRNGIAAARASDGQVLTSFAPTGSCAHLGHAIAAANGRVFVGGDGCPIAAFESSSGDQAWAWPRRANATAAAVLTAGGRVYVGGAFTQLAGIAANGLAALDQRTGKPAATWHPYPTTQVFSLTASGGRILVGAR